MNKMRTWNSFAFVSVGLLAGLGGCGGESAPPDASTGNPCGTTSDLTNASPLVAIATQIYSPDLSTRTDSIQFADNLTISGKIDPARTIELPTTNSTLWPSAKEGEMFLADASTGSVIKYGFAKDGSIAKIGEIGFGAYGVTSFHWTLVVPMSPTKAFLFDEITLQGFVWNPECMTITSHVNLVDQFKPKEGTATYTVWRERQYLEVDGKYYSAFQYVEPSSADLLPRSGLLVIDTNDDSFSVIEHPACGGLNNSVLGPDGLIYSASGIIAAGNHFLGVPDAPCLVRFDPKKMAWDDTYHPDLATLAGGAKFAGALYKNKGNPNAPVYMRVLLDSAVPASIKNPYNLSGAPLWRTFAFDNLANPTSLTDTGIAMSGGLVYPIEIDDKTYVSDAALLEGKSWLVDLSVEPPAHAIEVGGWGFFAVKLH